MLLSLMDMQEINSKLYFLWALYVQHSSKKTIRIGKEKYKNPIVFYNSILNENPIALGSHRFFFF